MTEVAANEGDPLLSLAAVRTKLTRLWLAGSGCSVLILVITSIFRGRADAAREVWSWFLPLVLPTIGLMVGVIGAAAILQRPKSYVRKSFADIAFWLSAAYLLLLLLTIVLEPFSPLRGAELHGMSNYWMGPFQGLVVAALGYLFTSEQKEVAPAESELNQHLDKPEAASEAARSQG
jgi:hypothetical protein